MSSLPRNSSFLFTEPNVGRTWFTLLVLIILVPCVFLTAVLFIYHRRVGFKLRHRVILSKFLELLVLSQLLVMVTSFSIWTDLECDPDKLGRVLGSDWTGNTLCGQMQQFERDAAGGCDWHETAFAVANLLAAWSGLLAFLGVWSYSTEGRAVSAFETIGLSVVLLANGVLFSAVYVWADTRRGSCRLPLAANACSIMFSVISFGLVIGEWFVPNRSTERKQLAPSSSSQERVGDDPELELPSQTTDVLGNI